MNNTELDKWAHWVLNGGIASKSEINNIGKGEQVFAGECTNKKCGTELISDEAYSYIHAKFLTMALNDREILTVHYRLLPSIPPMRCNRLKAQYLGLRLSTYEKRLSRARKDLLNIFH